MAAMPELSPRQAGTDRRGFGHVPRPREIAIDDKSSSEHRPQTVTDCFRPRSLYSEVHSELQIPPKIKRVFRLIIFAQDIRLSLSPRLKAVRLYSRPSAMSEQSESNGWDGGI